VQELQTNPHHAKRWQILFVIAIAQLMVILDATIVNIALPSAQDALQFSDDLSQWVVTAYALAFGSLLLVGGRIGDLFGRKRVFVVGLLGFAGASALGGFAQSFEVLVAARALQGVFGALLAPAALSILTTTFVAPEERAKAFAVFGAIAVIGAAVGLILGGVLTDYLNWRWCLYVNLAFALPAALGAQALLHDEVQEHRPRIDVPGTITASIGLFAIVYGLANAETTSWTDPLTVGMLVAGVLLLAGFVLIQRRSRNPLLPLRIVIDRDRGGSFLAVCLAGAGLFSAFLFLTFYLQRTLGFSPTKTGLAFLPLTFATIITASTGSTKLLPRFGPRPMIGGGMAICAAGMVALTGVGVDTAYVSHVLPGLVMVGAGLGFIFGAAFETATQGVQQSDAGVASAMANTMQQIGGSIGIALLSTLAATATDNDLAGVAGPPNPSLVAEAAVHGYTTAFAWGAVIYAVGAIVCSALLNSRRRLATSATPGSEPDRLRADSRQLALDFWAASPVPVQLARAWDTREWDPSRPLRQPQAVAMQPNDTASPRRSLGTQLSRGSKIALSLGGVCAVVGVGLFLLLRADDAREVTMYSSLPLQGPQRGLSEDMLRGMRLALKEADNKAGDFDVKFVSLDDSTAEARTWDSSAVIANATRAAGDEDTAVYIGELNSGASALSIPVLSSAKVPQISPSNTAVGLTTDESGADRGEPGKYYVGGFRNYVRLVPRDTIQGEALATLMKRDGCERAAVIHDRELYGEGLADNIRESMQTQGLRRVLDEPLESREPAYHLTLARRLVLQRADCVVFSGNDTSAAVRLFKAVGDALPSARLYGGDGVADRAFTDVNQGGLPEPLADRMKLTVAALGPEGFGAEGKTFFARFRQEYPDHKNPDPYAIYGYEAMSLALDAIKRAGSADREDIVRALFDTKDRSSVIGRYSIDANGDTTLTDYGVFAIQDGAPTFERKIKVKPRAAS
jgi:EmrB/QacA subfamily drug resistance transporter